MLTTWQALLLGAIEGLTEFLPVSSTGHLILAGQALGLEAGNFLKSFEIIIQLGAILAVIVVYGRTVLRRVAVWTKIIVAFLPTAIIGLLFYSVVKEYLLGNTNVVLWALGLGGLALIIFELWYRQRAPAIAPDVDLAAITYRQAFLIGLAQSLAIVPGVSRAAATIVGGLALGLPRRTIVEFSFLLAVPTMVAATGLDLVKNASAFSSDQFAILLIGFLTAFFVAWLAIKYFLRFIENHTFVGFGVYRILLVVLVLAVILST